MTWWVDLEAELNIDIFLNVIFITTTLNIQNRLVHLKSWKARNTTSGPVWNVIWISIRTTLTILGWPCCRSNKAPAWLFWETTLGNTEGRLHLFRLGKSLDWSKTKDRGGNQMNTSLSGLTTAAQTVGSAWDAVGVNEEGTNKDVNCLNITTNQINALTSPLSNSSKNKVKSRKYEVKPTRLLLGPQVP